MKQFIILSLCFLNALWFSSCTKENDAEADQPFRILLPANAQDTAFARRNLRFDVEVYAKAGLQKVELRRDFQVVEGSGQVFEGNPVSGTYNFSFIPETLDIGKKFDFVVVAYDKNGFTSSTIYSVYIKQAPVNISIQIPETAPDTLLLLSDIISFDVSVVSELEIKSISTRLNGNEIDSLAKTSFTDPLQDEYAFRYKPSDLDIGQQLNFTFAVTDIEDKVQTAEYTIFIKGERPPQQVVQYEARLGGQFSTEDGHFLNTATGSTHFRTGVAAISESIDLLLFVSGAATGVNLTAPSFGNAPIIYSVANSGEDAIVNWPFRNTTELIRLENMTEADFNAIHLDTEIVTLFENGGTTTDNVNRIQAGQIIVFKTVKNKHGILFVKTLPANNRSALVADIKMQP